MSPFQFISPASRVFTFDRTPNRPLQPTSGVHPPGEGGTLLAPSAAERQRWAVMKRLSPLAAALVLNGCQYDPYAHTYTTDKPEAGAVVGRYVLQDQTLVPGGASAMRGRPCEVVLAADGTFTATNVPPFDFSAPPISSLDELASGSGRWEVESVGSIDSGLGGRKTHWGVRLGSAGHPMAFAGFTGQGPPYGLIFTIGDPDGGTVMILNVGDGR